MTDPTLSFSTHQRLMIRLLDAINKGHSLSFLVGAALTADGGSPPRRGVPGVKGIIDRIRDTFTDPEESTLFEEEVKGHLSPSDQYQRAMKFLIDCRGPAEMNRVIQNAVLQARLGSLTVEPSTPEACQKIEADLAGWSLPPAVEALGQLVARHPNSLRAPILTTNFDPLIEVAIRRAHGTAETVCLSSDGNFNNLLGHNLSRVVHLHGYWYGSDTLHTPQQLTRERPRLKGCLREHLRDTTLVVMAYGGWGDVITRTLIETVAEGSERLNVIWCFHSSDEARIREDYSSFLKATEQAAGQRIVFYTGIDCHRFLPRLLEKTSNLQPSSAGVSLPISIRDRATSTPERGRFAQDVSDPCDSPPLASVWIGRSGELQHLRNSSVKVITITAIGGQGKSALAARYIHEVESGSDPKFEFWDWRDCREQSDQIQTKMLSIIERLTDGKVTAGHLAGQPIESIVQTFFLHLGQRRILFVFDNIDHYVDVQNGYPAFGMKHLFDAALTEPHQSKFVFTCRPAIRIDHPSADTIQLAEFSQSEAESLFRAHGADLSRVDAQNLVAEAYGLTGGHALWLNLIAIQAARKLEAVTDLLARIRQRKSAGLPDQTIHSIWSSLDEYHHSVLRTMAEIVRPETETNISSYVEDRSIHYGKLQKILKNLRSQGLLVIVRSKGAEGFDLHPLIRQFVRETYSPKERATFIRPIILYFDNMIVRCKAFLTRSPSMSILENWTHKVELETNSGSYDQALLTLEEVSGPLQVAGHHEELVRVASRLFDQMDWTASMSADVSRFSHAFGDMVKCLIELGRADDADTYLDRYESAAGKSALFVQYCNLRCYAYWYRHDFRSAIEWGKRGQTLKTTANIDTLHDCAHYLALAERDGGSVDGAMIYFLGDKTVDEVVTVDALPGKNAEFYGNIGRCLWFKSDTKRALICYKKSAVMLEREEHRSSICNQGYARFWIGEALLSLGEYDIAYYFFRSAIEKWAKVAPPRAKEAEAKVAEVRAHLQPFEAFADRSDQDVERLCRRWLFD